MRKFLIVTLLSVTLLSQKLTETFAAASLSLSPSTGNFTLSTPFNIDVKLDTGTDNIKTVKAYLTFPSNLLTVEDIIATGTSIVSWTERLYSNSSETISLSGETGSSGISGTGKLIATIKFRAKSGGTAPVRFTSDSQVLKNDGSDVLSLTSSTAGSYTLGSVATITTQPTSTPSAAELPGGGFYLPTVSIIGISLFLISLGILMGRNSSRSP